MGRRRHRAGQDADQRPRHLDSDGAHDDALDPLLGFERRLRLDSGDLPQEGEACNIAAVTKTALYARISDDRQDGAGVDRQLEDCRALVKREGWEPAAEFVDGSTSAFNGKIRARYQALLAAVKAGEVGRIVVWHIDRLYRQPRELEDVIDLADAGRVQVMTVRAGDLNLGTDAGITMARVAVAFANQESRDKSKRIKRAKQQAREKGLPSGGQRPFGWKATWTLDATTGKKRRLLTEDPQEATCIRTAIAELLAGASLAAVAKRWNDAKVPQTQTGRSNWTAQLVRQVVSNPRLAGLMGHRVLQLAADGVGQRYLPWAVVGEASWPGIVDRKQWEQLQALLDLRGAAGHMPRRRSLLTGLVTCATCGGTMVRSGARGRSVSGGVRKVWRCMRTGGGHGSIDAAGLEALLTEATLQRADTASLATVVREQGRQGRQAAELVAQLDELGRSMDAASGSFAAGRLPIRAFEHASAEIQRKQRALQGRLGSLTATAALEPYAGRRGLLRGAWTDLSIDQRRAIIAAALGRVTVSPVRKPGRPSFDPARVRIGPSGTRITTRSRRGASAA
jgi:site-specific DNA recombinase